MKTLVPSLLFTILLSLVTKRTLGSSLQKFGEVSGGKIHDHERGPRNTSLRSLSLFCWSKPAPVSCALEGLILPVSQASIPLFRFGTDHLFQIPRSSKAPNKSLVFQFV